MVELVSDSDYVFTPSNIILIQKLFVSKKREALFLTQQEYECVKKILDGAAKSALKAETKQKYADWFSQQCFVSGLITTAYYQRCAQKSILKDVFFDLADDHYAAAYQFKFTANKISFLFNDCRREIDADVFLHRYNETTKNRNLVSKAVIMDLFQLQNPAEIACFKEIILTCAEKAELIQAKWRLPSNKKNVASMLVFNENERKFFIQKDSKNIELKPNDFLNDFKKQYRKERPWYGSVTEWFGFGMFGKLKGKSTEAAKIELLLNHAKKSSEGTTAKTLESLFQSTDFLEDFKKQYRKERPWYGFLTEKMGAGTLGKLSEKQKNAIGFLQDHGKTKSDSTTAKTLESLKQFAVYAGSAENKSLAEKENNPVVITDCTEISPISTDRQSLISSDRLSVEAMLQRNDFFRQRLDFEKEEQDARESLSSNLLIEFERSLESISEQEKIKRIQKQKQIIRGSLLRDIECALKPVWAKVNHNEKNSDGSQKKYIEAKDVGARKIQYHLFFNDEEIAALSVRAVDDALKKHQWIQSLRVFYEKFSVFRDSLENALLSDEVVGNKVNEFMSVVNRLTAQEFLDKNVFKNLSRACALYQINVDNMKDVSAVSAMRL